MNTEQIEQLAEETLRNFMNTHLDGSYDDFKKLRPETTRTIIMAMIGFSEKVNKNVKGDFMNEFIESTPPDLKR
jgi:hypothetical protein